MKRLSTLTRSCLKKAGINSLEELAKLDNEEIAKIRGIGKRSYDEILMVLERADVHEI